MVLRLVRVLPMFTCCDMLPCTSVCPSSVAMSVCAALLRVRVPRTVIADKINVVNLAVFDVR